MDPSETTFADAMTCPTASDSLASTPQLFGQRVVSARASARSFAEDSTRGKRRACIAATAAGCALPPAFAESLEGFFFAFPFALLFGIVLSEIRNFQVELGRTAGFKKPVGQDKCRVSVE